MRQEKRKPERMKLTRSLRGSRRPPGDGRLTVQAKAASTSGRPLPRSGPCASSNCSVTLNPATQI